VSGDEHRRIVFGKVFQARGPATAKARSPSVERRVASTVKSTEEAERRRRRGSIFSTGKVTSCRYLGAVPCKQWSSVYTCLINTRLQLILPVFSAEFNCCSVLCSICLATSSFVVCSARMWYCICYFLVK